MRTVFARHRSDQDKAALHHWLQLVTDIPVYLGQVNRILLGHVRLTPIWYGRLTLYSPNESGRRFFGTDSAPALIAKRFITTHRPPDWVRVARTYVAPAPPDEADRSADFNRWSAELARTTDRLVRNLEYGDPDRLRQAASLALHDLERGYDGAAQERLKVALSLDVKNEHGEKGSPDLEPEDGIIVDVPDQSGPFTQRLWRPGDPT